MYYIRLFLQDLRESEEEEAAMENLVCTFVCVWRKITEVSIQKCSRNNSGGHQQIILQLQSCKSTLYIFGGQNRL